MKISVALLCALVFAACSIGKKEPAEKKPVVISLLGKEYFEPERSEEAQEKLEDNLESAKENWEEDPSEDNYVWYGRRLAYLSRFQQAIDVFTEGLEKYPNSAKLYRHRGHRFISIRLFDRAISDLTKANQLIAPVPLEIEPDGAPNKLNRPLSSLQFNIRYHLALAYYLKGDFVNALIAYQNCLTTCDNDDLLVATVDWMYMTDMRSGHPEDAKSILGNITENMTIIENDSYYKRCLMYQGKLTPESLLEVGDNDEDKDLTLATQGYGVGNWYYYHGDTVKAKEIFEKVVAGKHFSSFGFIAAEADLARWKK